MKFVCDGLWNYLKRITLDDILEYFRNYNSKLLLEKTKRTLILMTLQNLTFDEETKLKNGRHLVENTIIMLSTRSLSQGVAKYLSPKVVAVSCQRTVLPPVLEESTGEPLPTSPYKFTSNAPKSQTVLVRSLLGK